MESIAHGDRLRHLGAGHGHEAGPVAPGRRLRGMEHAVLPGQFEALDPGDIPVADPERRIAELDDGLAVRERVFHRIRERGCGHLPPIYLVQRKDCKLVGDLPLFR